MDYIDIGNAIIEYVDYRKTISDIEKSRLQKNLQVVSPDEKDAIVNKVKGHALYCDGIRREKIRQLLEDLEIENISIKRM